MQTIAALLMLLSSVLLACDAAAQERTDARVELEETPAYQGREAVSIQVAMVEYLAADAADVHAIGSPEQLDAWMKELGAAQKLLAVTTMEMSTVDGGQTMSQFGERAAVVTGRTRVAQGPVNSSGLIHRVRALSVDWNA